MLSKHSPSLFFGKNPIPPVAPPTLTRLPIILYITPRITGEKRDDRICKINLQNDGCETELFNLFNDKVPTSQKANSSAASNDYKHDKTLYAYIFEDEEQDNDTGLQQEIFRFQNAPDYLDSLDSLDPKYLTRRTLSMPEENQEIDSKGVQKKRIFRIQMHKKGNHFNITFRDVIKSIWAPQKKSKPASQSLNIEFSFDNSSVLCDNALKFDGYTYFVYHDANNEIKLIRFDPLDYVVKHFIHYQMMMTHDDDSLSESWDCYEPRDKHQDFIQFHDFLTSTSIIIDNRQYTKSPILPSACYAHHCSRFRHKILHAAEQMLNNTPEETLAQRDARALANKEARQKKFPAVATTIATIGNLFSPVSISSASLSTLMANAR